MGICRGGGEVLGVVRLWGVLVENSPDLLKLMGSEFMEGVQDMVGGSGGGGGGGGLEGSALRRWEEGEGV